MGVFNGNSRVAATCQMVQFDGRQLRSPIKNYNSFFPSFRFSSRRG